MNEEREPAQKGKSVIQEIVVPENLQTIYATGLYIYRTENEFFLHFLLTAPPIIVSPEDFDKIDKVTALVIARVILSPGTMEATVKLMQENLKVFHAQKAQSRGGSDD